MNDQEFFSAKHKSLLKIASLAKHMAWITLIIFALAALSEFLQNTELSNYLSPNSGSSGFPQLFKQAPLYSIRLILLPLMTLLKGLIYHFVLKGISLGLNMIVETDINYREQKKAGELA